jgi:hypothetical protein
VIRRVSWNRCISLPREVRGPGRGIAGPVLMLIRELIACMVRMIASLPEQVRTGEFSDMAPERISATGDRRPRGMCRRGSSAGW